MAVDVAEAHQINPQRLQRAGQVMGLSPERIAYLCDLAGKPAYGVRAGNVQYIYSPCGSMDIEEAADRQILAETGEKLFQTSVRLHATTLEISISTPG